MDIENHVVVVTGAAGGIGRELCRSFAREGSRIGMVDRDGAALELLADELRETGAQCEPALADVCDRDQVHDAVGRITASLGDPDILVPSAGICRASTVDDLRVRELEDVIRTNYLGLVYAVEAVLPAMLRRGRGHIVGISSMAGVRAIPFETAYCASKAAVEAFLESIRAELRRRGITVTISYPAYVRTGLLDEINAAMGADMSDGRALTVEQAAFRIMRGVRRRHSRIYLPRGLGMAVRLSFLLPPRLYDLIMWRLFSRYPIARPTTVPEIVEQAVTLEEQLGSARQPTTPDTP